MRKTLKLFSILSSLTIFLIPTSSDPLACSYGPDDEELRYMLFNPDLSENKSWWSFFYSYKLNYLDGTVRSDADERMLAQEWIDHLKLSAKPEDAYQALFGGLADSALQQNNFFHEVRKNKPAYEYFKIAKACEEACAYPADPWYPDPELEKVLTGKRLELQGQLQKIIANESDNFFKKKYGFQLLKVSFYNNDETKFNTYYNAYFKGEEKHLLDWWALHYKAELLDLAGNLDSANYLHARVFSHSSAKMFVSKQHFSRKHLETLLALTKTDEDRADVLVLSEVINPGRSLPAIQEIYRLKPDHKHLPMLISREINKLESWLASGYVMLQSNEANYVPGPLLPGTSHEQDILYAEQFAEALGNMPELKNLQPEVYLLSAAYVSLLAERPVEAAEYLNQIVSEKYNYQKTVLEAVLLARQEDLRSPDIQEALGKKLELLIGTRKQKFESQKILFSLASYLRYEFARKGMIAQAGLLDNLANNKFCEYCSGSSLEYEQVEYLDHNASAADVSDLLGLYHKRDKNTLETVLLKPYSNVNYLYDLLAVKYLREGKLIEAYETLKKIPDEFWYSFSNANASLDRNPFTQNDELLAAGTMEIYNKREIVEQLIKLEQEAQASPARQADNYFKLGNAWYNFTAHAWFMLRYRWTTYPGERDQGIEKIARNRARSYYKMALDIEQRPENKAKLLYMLVLLNDQETARAYARQYEQLENTEFYKKRNCLTTMDLAQN